MNKVWEIFRSKIFYVALGVGVVAFASLVVAYNYKDAKKELSTGQAIDLNQPVDEQIAGNTNADENNEPVAQIGKINEDSKKDKTNKTTEKPASVKEEEDRNKNAAKEDESTEESAVAASSDGAVADSKKEFNYNGGQDLSWPLIGDVILPYSMDTTVYYQTLNAYKCNPGMLIKGAEGANVMSVFEGVVENIYETKEHGTVVEINLGNGYMATYGQLMNVCVNVGDVVSADQNIAEVGPVSSYYTEEGTHLYFQISKDNEPINPLTLIK
ncbi:MAG: peptidoglycan DD-metalloendopeptidase family protein [Lachnospiraceae bacterium]|nr:peptidoglycan DD-metalloendopeptidase family protein [Lachnospiraceae bacterium]